MCEETAALPVLGLGLYLLCKRETRGRGAVIVGVGAAALALALAVWLPAFGGDGVLPTARRYASLGSTWSDLLVAPLTRPALFWGRLFSAPSAAYVLALLAPLAFLPLLAPRALLVALPPLLQVLLADGAALRGMTGHYEALLLPGLAWATVQAIERVAGWRWIAGSEPTHRPHAPAWLALLPLVATPLFHASMGRGHFSDLATPGSTDFARVVAAVPPDAGVAATARLQTRLADRAVASILQGPADLPTRAADVPFDALLWSTAEWGPPIPGGQGPPAGFAPALTTPSCTLYVRVTR